MLKLGRGVAQHVLIAGKTGSGKSTLLHALVTNLSMWYSPEEVEFYLVDFKKGVEFKTYATHHLPHARAIAVESDREFGLSVLQRLDAELTRRGNLYRKLGVQDLPAFRAQSPGVAMPRTLLIIDEFQEFFSEDDKLSQEAQLLLDRLVRQGRAFGIHVLLGSQTIGGSSGLARTTIGQMAVRIALQTSEADSHLILGDNNAAARLLSRPGEAIYNDQGGLVEGNSPFQIAWLPDEKREQYLKRVQQKAVNTKMEVDHAIVFEGNAPADIHKNSKLEKMLTQSNGSSQQSSAVAFLGEPVAIKEPTGVVFRRQSGSNMLVIGQQEESAAAIAAMSMISLAAQQPEATFYLMDGTPADSLLAGFLPRVAEVLPNHVKTIDYRAVPEAMAELTAELKKRQETEHQLPAIYVVIFALQRYRVLRKTDEGGFSFSASEEEKPEPADKQFADLLREGPPLGIHVIAWADTPAAVDRTLERASMREFDNRILFQMSATDSSNLIDSPAGNKLGFHRALAYSEEQGVMEKFRPYALPDAEWLGHVKQALAGRK
jgi:DNA segregation ATPase FtsK/SpoIIIE, S-DNA-T family